MRRLCSAIPLTFLMLAGCSGEPESRSKVVPVAPAEAGTARPDADPEASPGARVKIPMH